MDPKKKKLSPWDRVLIARHPKRPRTVDYIQHMCDEFEEIAGDRTFGDDPAVVAGFARIGGVKFVLVGQEKGKDTESRMKRNFGYAYPEGFRKALRAMKLAEKFHLPVVSLIDTPGAFPGLQAEQRGIGRQIAENLKEMSRLKTPIIVLIIGEGCSGGALALAVGDVVAMLEHSFYSVISPEGCASILWKDPGKNAEAASSLKLNAEDLISFAIVDDIIREPEGGAHNNPEETYASCKSFILKKWEVLKDLSAEVLLENRYQKFRKMGRFEEIF